MSSRNLARTLTWPIFCALLWVALPVKVGAQPVATTTPPIPQATPSPEPPEEVPPAQVAICHRASGANEAARSATIRVPGPALREHLAHGDTLGACSP